MVDKNSRPLWGVLYLGVALLIGIFFKEATATFSPSAHRIAEIGIVLLIFIFIKLWLFLNEQALWREESRNKQLDYASQRYLACAINFKAKG